MSDSTKQAPNIDEQPVTGLGMPKEQRELMNSRVLATQFGNMVTVMMQSPNHKNLRLADLPRRMVPALLHNQFRVSEARKKGSGSTAPVGMIMWARVSDEVHERLSSELDKPLDLAPEEWNGGRNYWIVDAIGSDRFVAPLLKNLREGEFKGKTVHYRAKTDDGLKVLALGGTQSEADKAAGAGGAMTAASATDVASSNGHAPSV